MGSMTKDYFKFLNKYLATFKGSDDDSATIGDAKEEAVAAIIEFVKSPDLFQVLVCSRLCRCNFQFYEKVQGISFLRRIPPPPVIFISILLLELRYSILFLYHLSRCEFF